MIAQLAKANFSLRNCTVYALTILFLLFSSKAYINHTYSLNFADEDDNFTVAKYLLQGEKLYGDIFSHHQPFSYVLSAAVQSVTQIDNINLLVLRHRQFMVAWAFLWSIFLLLRFRFHALPFIFIYELSKIYLLGNSFLAEGLVVYPLVYLAIFTLETKPKERIIPIEVFFIGISIGVSVLLLSPLWPLLSILLLINLHKWKWKHYARYIVLLLGGLLPFVFTVTKISTLNDYFHNAFYINFTYYINTSAQFSSLVKSFATPLSVFSGGIEGTQTLWVIRATSILFIIVIAICWKRSSWYRTLLLILILGLTNIRYVQPGTQLYQGFHLLPWYSVFIATVGYEAVRFIQESKKLKSILPISFLLLCCFSVAIYHASQDLFPKVDQQKEAYIAYSHQYDIGKAMQILNDNGTVFIAGAEPLIYWQSNADHASRFVFYYPWMANVPEFQEEVSNMFKKNPPTFLYNPGTTKEVEIYNIKKYLSNYQAIKKNNKPTNLYMLKSSTSVSQEKKEALHFYNFTF